MRTAAIALGIAALLGFGAYTGYVVVAGSEKLLHPVKLLDCRTPQTAYGWTYEAINYDGTTDKALRPISTVKDGRIVWGCDGTPAPAGGKVVTSDGMHLAGWYIPSAKAAPTGPTIVLVHGRGANKSDYLRYAVPFHDAYNVVIFDLRGAGQSTDAPVTLGVNEQRDLKAELDWLMATKHPTWVAAVGTSMGAATVLATAVVDQRIRAVVLDSMHARMATGIARGIERDEHLIAFPTQAAAFFGAQLRTGVDLSSADPLDTIGKLLDRPVLLTHGSADAYDLPAESLQLNLDAATAAGVDVEVHICARAGHDEVIDTCPADWKAWVTSFLTDARAADEAAGG